MEESAEEEEEGTLGMILSLSLSLLTHMHTDKTSTRKGRKTRELGFYCNET
jgi:hypothetical protein